MRKKERRETTRPAGSTRPAAGPPALCAAGGPALGVAATAEARTLAYGHAAFSRLLRGVRRLNQSAAALLNAVTDVGEDLRGVCRVVEAESSGRLVASVECALLRRAQARRREVQRAASSGARTLEMSPAAKGAAMVRIDGGVEFRLSRADARLLRLLACAPTAQDGWPDWVTYAGVADSVLQEGGASPTRQAIVESVYRVRRALKCADLNEQLIRVERKHGRMRFLLRKEAAQPNPAREVGTSEPAAPATDGVETADRAPGGGTSL